MADSLHSKGITSTGRFQLVTLAALLVVAGGTLGFMLLEGMDPLDAVYMTVITLSTVGYGEVHPLHPAGRIFVICLIVFGMAVGASFAAMMGEKILAGHFKSMVARKKMENQLRKLNGHYIIAGFGRVGRQVAREFEGKTIPWVVIERDEAAIDQIVADGMMAVQGDATDDQVLARAGIERAHTLISTLPEEAQNVYLTLTARYMNPSLKIIARADFEEGEKKLVRAGADHVVIPHVLGGIRMAKAALQPHVVDYMQMASMGDEGFLVEEVVVPEGSPLAGKSLADTQLEQDFGITVIGIKQPGKRMNINPSAQTVLGGQDVVVVVGRGEDLERFSAAIG